MRVKPPIYRWLRDAGQMADGRTAARGVPGAHEPERPRSTHPGPQTRLPELTANLMGRVPFGGDRDEHSGPHFAAPKGHGPAWSPALRLGAGPHDNRAAGRDPLG